MPASIIPFPAHDPDPDDALLDLLRAAGAHHLSAVAAEGVPDPLLALAQALEQALAERAKGAPDTKAIVPDPHFDGEFPPQL